MNWTPYPQVDEVLAALLAASRDLFSEDLFGVYLFGSLTSGGFDPETSDIDFAVATKTDPSSRSSEISALNRQLQDSSPWAAKLEGSFLPRRVFEDFNPDGAAFPTIGMGGWYGLDHKGIERALQRFQLREHGIALAGPSPRSFIAPVSSESLKAETLDVLQGWWRSQLDDPVRLRRRGYQAYAVLTMCRMLYTLEIGSVASKPAAAGWARPRVAAPWQGMIDRALVWRDGDGVDDFEPTVELIHWMLSTTPISPPAAPPHR